MEGQRSSINECISYMKQVIFLFTLLILNGIVRETEAKGVRVGSGTGEGMWKHSVYSDPMILYTLFP